MAAAASSSSTTRVFYSTLAFSRSNLIPSARPITVSVFRRRHRWSCNVFYYSAPAAKRAASVTSENERLQLIRSPELVAQEYADLNLTDKFSEELGHVRIRQHVNPLRSSLMVPAEVPDWNLVYKDAKLPLMVDIGCGSGRFLMWLAKRSPSSKNYLGLEIRRKLVDRARYWVNELALSNIHFIFANASVSFKQLVSTYPGPLMLVSILLFACAFNAQIPILRKSIIKGGLCRSLWLSQLLTV